MWETLGPWEQLLKRMLWSQLGTIANKRILDFGSGIGVTAEHFAAHNHVVAVEPDPESVQTCWTGQTYQKIQGDVKTLAEFEDGSFDVIFCHNVLEYAPDREEILREFSRLLKPDGYLSVVKHNRAGRVMQMVVLLNAFDHAGELLDGQDGVASKYGTIHYYEDEDLTRWCEEFVVEKTYGIRTFWDLQQNQEIHRDPQWQEQMLAMEERVAEQEEYRAIAFFHHLILKKNH
ncbi:MAG: methyltransferase domain-containing protein [Lachnospiraceae bacterium]|nr:methyltransferase domain-containing protein [Lachnospiraceae bacterium]